MGRDYILFFFKYLIYEIMLNFIVHLEMLEKCRRLN